MKVQNPFIHRARGRAGGLIAQTYNRNTYLRSMPKSFNYRNTPNQQAQRNKYLPIKNLSNSLIKEYKTEITRATAWNKMPNAYLKSLLYFAIHYPLSDGADIIKLHPPRGEESGLIQLHEPLTDEYNTMRIYYNQSAVNPTGKLFGCYVIVVSHTLLEWEVNRLTNYDNYLITRLRKIQHFHDAGAFSVYAAVRSDNHYFNIVRLFYKEN